MVILGFFFLFSFFYIIRFSSKRFSEVDHFLLFFLLFLRFDLIFSFSLLRIFRSIFKIRSKNNVTQRYIIYFTYETFKRRIKLIIFNIGSQWSPIDKNQADLYLNLYLIFGFERNIGSYLAWKRVGPHAWGHIHAFSGFPPTIFLPPPKLSSIPTTSLQDSLHVPIMITSVIKSFSFNISKFFRYSFDSKLSNSSFSF